MKKVMKLSTKEKTQAQQEEDERRTNEMIRFGMTFKDHLGNPWFLPVEGGGYAQNFSCTKTVEEFNNGFRIYIGK